jgi:hypothetical protein
MLLSTIFVGKNRYTTQSTLRAFTLSSMIFLLPTCIKYNLDVFGKILDVESAKNVLEWRMAFWLMQV